MGGGGGEGSRKEGSGSAHSDLLHSLLVVVTVCVCGGGVGSGLSGCGGGNTRMLVLVVVSVVVVVVGLAAVVVVVAVVMVRLVVVVVVVEVVVVLSVLVRRVLCLPNLCQIGLVVVVDWLLGLLADGRNVVGGVGGSLCFGCGGEFVVVGGLFELLLLGCVFGCLVRWCVLSMLHAGVGSVAASGSYTWWSCEMLSLLSSLLSENMAAAASFHVGSVGTGLIRCCCRGLARGGWRLLKNCSLFSCATAGAFRRLKWSALAFLSLIFFTFFGLAFDFVVLNVNLCVYTLCVVGNCGFSLHFLDGAFDFAFRVLTRARHWCLFAAALLSSSQLDSVTSIRRSPCCLLSKMTFSVSLICRVSPDEFVSILIMFPTHLSLRARIHAITLKVVVVAEASSLFDLFVMCDSMNALAPLMRLQFSSFKIQLSDL